MCVCVCVCVSFFGSNEIFFFFCKGRFRSRVNVGVNVGRDSMNLLLLWNVPTRIGKLEIVGIVGSCCPHEGKK